MKINFVPILVILAIGHVSFAINYSGRISGGINSTVDHKFTVRVLSALSDITQQGTLSSGVAVTPRHIVTVAQAIVGFNVWYIGHNSIFVHNQTITTTRDATPHGDYDPDFLQNNVGVIRVNEPMTSYQPINDVHNLQITMLAFGYGHINDQNQLAPRLQFAILHAQPHSICVNNFNSSIVRENNFCATSDSQIRNGDQGGPVINLVTFEVSGIISSWGSTVGSSIIMEDLSQHRDFLDPLLNDN